MRPFASNVLRALCLTVLAAPAAGQDRPVISIDEPLCMQLGGHPRVVVAVRSTEPPTRARILFQSELGFADHYVEMRPSPTEAGRYWAVLPRLLPGVSDVYFSVSVETRSGVAVATPRRTLTAASDCRVFLTSAETSAASSLVVGQTKSGQPVFPPGFDCRDIARQITPDGMMRAVTGCSTQEARAALAAPALPFSSGTAVGPGSPSSGDGLVFGGVGGTKLGPGVVGGQSSPARPGPDRGPGNK